jgi:hypothetical protein
MDRIRIVPAANYPGEGISRGLARGLLVYYGDCHLTGEGMGLGSVALRDREYTYFSRSWKDSDEKGILRRTFTLDTRMKWSIGGIPSRLLTRGIESGISAYMQFPMFQRFLLLPVHPIRSLLGIHPLFETVPSRGDITFTYQVTGNHVKVHADFNVPVRKESTLCLLNELSAAWFTAGWEGERAASPPPGWEKVSPDELPVSLVDPVHGIRFCMGKPSVVPEVPVALYRGRELNGDHCWAGFCIQLDIPKDLQILPEVRYDIGFTPGAGS